MHEDRRKDILQRLRCVEGHARGVARMVETQADCLSIIRQVKAVQGALEKVAQLLLQEHLTTCLPAALLSEDPESQERAMVEVADLLTLTRTS